MSTVEKLLVSIALVIALMFGVTFLDNAVKMEMKGEIFVLEDQAKKTATALDITAAPGDRSLSKEQVLTTLLALPLDIEVYVNNYCITPEIRQQAILEKTSIKPYVLHAFYEAYYEYGIDGTIKKATYKSIS